MTQTEKKRPVLRRRLENLAALASPILALMFLTYLQSKPNTSHVALTGLFNGERAFADLERIVAFGPRPAGSKNLEFSRGWILDQLHRAGVETEQDSFVAATPLGSVPMTNLVAKIPGASPSIVILGGHYDTKRMATPFVGANDGGSSAAFLIELARELACAKQKLTDWLVFFDGEEALAHWSATDGLYGSRHFAEQLRQTGAEDRVKAAIIVDMIGDAHLDIQGETYSTPWLTNLVFIQARSLGYGRYFRKRGRRIEDDHLPFLRLGIPAVDFIDLDYGPFNLDWHSQSDTLDKCSAASLAIVGATILKALDALESRCSVPGIAAQH